MEMKPDVDKTVHPFFDKHWRSLRTHTADDQSLTTSSAPPKDLAETARAKESLKLHPALAAKHTEGGESEAQSGQESKIDGPLRKPDGAVRPTGDLLLPRHMGEARNDRKDVSALEEDLNLDRRKRRRTTSPQALSRSPHNTDLPPLIRSSSWDDLSWQQQLEMATKESAADPVGEPRKDLSASLYHQEEQSATFQEESLGHLENHQMLSNKPAAHMHTDLAGSPASAPSPSIAPPLTNPLPSPWQSGLDGASDSPKSELPSPKKPATPKKMLRLNAQGKFSSPISKAPVKSSAPSKDEKKGRITRARSTQKNPSQLIAVLKYGGTDEARSRIGRQIESIINGNSKVESTPPLTAPQDAKPVVPQGPPKPTHPFFLGKAARNAGMAKASADPLALSPAGSAPLTENENKGGARSADRDTATKLSAHLQRSSVCPTFTNIMNRSAALKFPGAIRPAWPWKGIAHVRGLDSSQNEITSMLGDSFTSDGHIHGPRKLKDAVIQVPKSDDIISNLSKRLNIGRYLKELEQDALHMPSEALRLPQRMLLTGTQIQESVRTEMLAKLPPISDESSESNDEDHLQSSEHPTKIHPAVSKMYHGIKYSFSPFDKSTCETQMWVQKYAPKAAAEVLQSGKEALLLRDWLSKLTVTSVESGTNEHTKTSNISNNSKRSGPAKSDSGKSKKKRKRAEDLDGFIISSEDEANEMNEVSDIEETAPLLALNSTSKKSVIRAGDLDSPGKQGRMANAVVLSGPSGSGKTAAAYAVANELNFEVFEINSGSRRSGKDILDKVGDMTRNHLVHHAKQDGDAANDEGLLQITDALRKELDSGRQGTMNTFFKPKAQAKAKSKQKQLTTKPEETQKAHIQQKKRQSVILLEEVDVLFEEDRQFWLTVLTLIAQSKRPVIMTCNDEAQLPFEALSLHAILRFASPSEDMVADYLLSLVGREGHLLQRRALVDLYKASHHDLRATITELDFWCQMAVGDQKGGLEWMPDYSNVKKMGEKSGEIVRVASKDTYQASMSLLNHDKETEFEERPFEREEELLGEMWTSWEIDVGDWNEHGDLQKWAERVSLPGEDRDRSLKSLKDFQTFLENSSAADIYSGRGLRKSEQVLIDATQPPISQKSRHSYVEGYALLEANSPVDYDNFDTHIGLWSKANAKHCLNLNSVDNSDNCGSPLRPLASRDAIRMITSLDTFDTRNQPLTRLDLSNAFDPIAEESKAKATPMQLGGMQSSVFDRTTTLIAEDLAPYVRSIVSYDLQLEAQRLKMSSLLSEGGRNGKRMRTTRASRSALEGGIRSNTRRERWFTNELNPGFVLKTAGHGWREAAEEVASAKTDAGSTIDEESSLPSSSPESV
ncbi:MAG: hypothetical protein M1819_000439 [Sarea resinae]|nr:MAG: hypothetical protein M1819_000439 [Sarea resinae]